MVGDGLDVMVTACDVVPVHPLLLVTVTVYVPAEVGLMVCVIAPVLHKYEVKPEVAVSVAADPLQGLNEPDIEGVGRGFTVTVALVLPVHPLLSVTVTVYEVVVLGVMVMAAVVAPVFHK